tara:strand:+ start:2786 stop:3202 length:417 start_codon:yes stop_codon:yes gene_type:complete
MAFFFYKDLLHVTPAAQKAWLYIFSSWDLHNEDGSEILETEWCDGFYPVLAYATAWKPKENETPAYMIVDDCEGAFWILHSQGEVKTLLFCQDKRPSAEYARQRVVKIDSEAFAGNWVETAHPLDLDGAMPPRFVCGG